MRLARENLDRVIQRCDSLPGGLLVDHRMLMPVVTEEHGDTTKWEHHATISTGSDPPFVASGSGFAFGGRPRRFGT